MRCVLQAITAYWILYFGTLILLKYLLVIISQLSSDVLKYFQYESQKVQKVYDYVHSLIISENE